MSTEVWKPVPVADEYARLKYQVSNKGRVRSWVESKKSWYILSPTVVGKNDHNVYPRVWMNGKKYAVHRLVADAFVPNDDPAYKKIVRHRDGDPNNAEDTNLCWGTQSDNSVDKLRHRRGRTLLSEQEVLQVRALRRNHNVTMQDLAKIFKVTPTTIRKIVTYKIWSHLP